MDFFKKWNPISKKDIEALRFPDQPNQSSYKVPHFERILQIHVNPPCSNPRANSHPLILSIRSFSALWHRYSIIHGASQASADLFYDDLIALLLQETEGTSRARKPKKNAKVARARTAWATPAPLLDILARTFGISYERYCSPLNFSPIFPYGSTIGNHRTTQGQRVDSRWGFDYDAKLQDWRDHFGYANPEWLEDDLIDCITRASNAANDNTKPVRNIAIIPYNSDFPAVKLHLDNSRHHHILAIFAPNTLAFTPPQVMQGTRSDFGAKPYANAVALVSWENSLAPQPDQQGLSLLGKWCADTLKTPNKSTSDARVLWSEDLPTAKQSFTDPKLVQIPPLHPFWTELSEALTPTDDNHALLQTTAGVISHDIKNIFAATQANPARCAAQLEKLTHDMVALFHEAWKESNTLIKAISFQKPPCTDPTIGDDSVHEGVDPDSDCRSTSSADEHQQALPRAAHQFQTQRCHTTAIFLKATLFKTHSKKPEFGSAKQRSVPVMIENIMNLLDYDEPLQRARITPDIATKCQYCKVNAAVRDFPNIKGGTTSSCAPCRTKFELKETYGRYTARTIKCHICGSHQNRSNKIHTPSSPTDPTGWARSSEGFTCAPCKATERRQTHYTTPPVNFALPNVRRRLKHNLCLICHKYSPQGGTFLHHRICSQHYTSAPTAHQITTARVWNYLTTHYPLFSGTVHNPITVSNFVEYKMSSGSPITVNLIAELAELTHDHNPHEFPKDHEAPPPPEHYTMWLLTTPIPHHDLPLAPPLPPTPPPTPPTSPLCSPPPSPTKPNPQQEQRQTRANPLSKGKPTNPTRTISPRNVRAEESAANMGLAPAHVQIPPRAPQLAKPSKRAPAPKHSTPPTIVEIEDNSPSSLEITHQVPLSALSPALQKICNEIAPFDLHTVSTTLLQKHTAHLHKSDLPDIPGWTCISSDSSDVSSDSSTRGRRRLARQIFENESILTFAETAADKAQRFSERYRQHLERNPRGSQAKSSLPEIMDHLQASLRNIELYRKKSTALRHALAQAKVHRFVRPPKINHPAWDVGLPDHDEILRVMSGGSPDDCILEARGFRITRKTLNRLSWPATSTAQYLDTSIIDTYLAILCDFVSSTNAGHQTQRPTGRRIHIVSSMITLKFFPTTYGPHDLAAVINLAALREIPLTDLDLLVFPLNPRGTDHWWSVVFDFTTHKIITHNSSPTPSRNATKYVRALKILVAELATTYHHPIWSWSSWDTIGPESSPKQGNAYDCGVFLCMTITHLALEAPLTLSQLDMPLYRQHIAKRILANTYCRPDADAQSSTRIAMTTHPSPHPKKTQPTPHTQGKRASSPESIRYATKDATTSTAGNKVTPGPSKRAPHGSLSSAKQQRKRFNHAATHRPLSPIHLAPLPDSPTAAARPHLHTANNPPPLTPTSHTPLQGGGCAGGPARSPLKESRQLVREEGRETIITSPTAIATNRIIDFGESSPTTTSNAAVYTRRHSHPG